MLHSPSTYLPITHLARCFLSDKDANGHGSPCINTIMRVPGSHASYILEIPSDGIKKRYRGTKGHGHRQANPYIPP